MQAMETKTKCIDSLLEQAYPLLTARTRELPTDTAVYKSFSTYLVERLVEKKENI